MAAGTRRYSERLGAISDNQLQRALDRFGLGKLRDVEPAVTGLFGQNLFLSATTGDYVLRGAPHPEWQFEKERFVTRLIHERTDVPVPWPFQVEASTEIFGWPFAIMPRMPGIDVGSPEVRERMSGAQRTSLARAMGETLARLHRLTWPQCGEYRPDIDNIRPIEASPADWAVERARWWLDRCRETSAATTEADVEWVEETIASVRAALDQPTRPSLVHHDYKENNVVAQETKDGWRISGLLDVGGAFFGDPEEDLCRSIAAYAREDMELARAFIAGYRERGALREGYKRRFRLYMLMDRLVIWEYGQRNHVWFQEGMTLREYAEPFTRLEPW